MAEYDLDMMLLLRKTGIYWPMGIYNHAGTIILQYSFGIGGWDQVVVPDKTLFENWSLVRSDPDPHPLQSDANNQESFIKW